MFNMGAFLVCKLYLKADLKEKGEKNLEMIKLLYKLTCSHKLQYLLKEDNKI